MAWQCAGTGLRSGGTCIGVFGEGRGGEGSGRQGDGEGRDRRREWRGGEVRGGVDKRMGRGGEGRQGEGARNNALSVPLCMDMTAGDSWTNHLGRHLG